MRRWWTRWITGGVHDHEEGEARPGCEGCQTEGLYPERGEQPFEPPLYREKRSGPGVKTINPPRPPQPDPIPRPAREAASPAALDVLRDIVQHWDAGDIDHDYDAISGAIDAGRDLVRATIGLSGEHRHPEAASPAALDALREVNDWLNAHPGVRMTTEDHAEWFAFLRRRGYDPLARLTEQEDRP
jgi:hypothetical protein